MGKKSRDKGIAFEREVSKVCRQYWSYVCRNLKQYQKTSGRDLDNTQPTCMQLKREARNTLYKIKMAYIEARESTSVEYPLPIAVWRDDNTRPEEDIMCMMKLKHLIELLCMVEDGEL